ncbi:pyrophosphatase PpaX [Vagococcus salmoninarum]|uniref:Pyrophosphatase PpaX n=1 Tax=Vagococcus salmoninarum TaxID=2739 RepID=A0A429ZMS7_9ENTE|nr:pyrophosphatase PpaX [Vagococcus salmoninarum]RST95004.1 pyrophosphatase PpaX [Vagococcus salmoninarum]
MSPITAVLFDFDGTIGDTNHLISESYLHVLNKHFPGEYTTDSVRKFNGPALEEVFLGVSPEHGLELVKEYREFNHQMHDELIRAFPDVPESLERLKAHGIKLAVVSTKYNTMLRHGLDVLGLTSYFDVILGGNDYEKVKPDPEPVLLGMSRLGSEKANTIMVGDNWQDIESAHNAGIEGVFVKWSQKTVAEMAPYKPDKIAESMIELTDWILARTTEGKN